MFVCSKLQAMININWNIQVVIATPGTVLNETLAYQLLSRATRNHTGHDTCTFQHAHVSANSTVNSEDHLYLPVGNSNIYRVCTEVWFNWSLHFFCAVFEFKSYYTIWIQHNSILLRPAKKFPIGFSQCLTLKKENSNFYFLC